MVSPFVNLPTAPTLSYNYKPMPSSLPPSILTLQPPPPPPPPPPSSSAAAEADTENNNLPRFVVSPSGVAAHPSEIMASCQALHAHLRRMEDEANRDLSRLEAQIRDRELAEKRRVAPGWLDRDERLLQPEKPPASESAPASDLRDRGGGGGGGAAAVSEMGTDEGEELDRVFGGLAVK